MRHLLLITPRFLLFMNASLNIRKLNQNHYAQFLAKLHATSAHKHACPVEVLFTGIGDDIRIQPPHPIPPRRNRAYSGTLEVRFGKGGSPPRPLGGGSSQGYTGRRGIYGGAYTRAQPLKYRARDNKLTKKVKRLHTHAQT